MNVINNKLFLVRKLERLSCSCSLFVDCCSIVLDSTPVGFHHSNFFCGLYYTVVVVVVVIIVVIIVVVIIIITIREIILFNLEVQFEGTLNGRRRTGAFESNLDQYRCNQI